MLALSCSMLKGMCFCFKQLNYIYFMHDVILVDFQNMVTITSSINQAVYVTGFAKTLHLCTQ